MPTQVPSTISYFFSDKIRYREIALIKLNSHTAQLKNSIILSFAKIHMEIPISRHNKPANAVKNSFHFKGGGLLWMFSIG